MFIIVEEYYLNHLDELVERFPIRFLNCWLTQLFNVSLSVQLILRIVIESTKVHSGCLQAIGAGALETGLRVLNASLSALFDGNCFKNQNKCI